MGSRNGERPIAELVRELVKIELAKFKMSGHGGNTNITSDKDINLTTIGGGKAYYNGVEIGTGVSASDLSNYVKKSAGAGQQDMYNTMMFKSANMLKFQSGGGVNAGYVYGFNGLTTYDLMVGSYGQLRLEGSNGILLNSPVQAFMQAGNIAMSGYKLTGLGAGTTNGDSVRYEQEFPGIQDYLTKYKTATSLGVSVMSEDGIGVNLNNNRLGSCNYIEGNSITQVLRLFGGSSATIPGLMVTNSYARAGLPFAFRVNHSSDDCYIQDASDGTMELHVPSGKKFKFVVG